MQMIQQVPKPRIPLASFPRQKLKAGKTGGWHRRAEVFLFLASFASTGWAQTIVVDATPGHVRNTIRPTEAVGAGIDRLPYGAADKLFVDSTLEQVLAAGWQTLTYRQNTELHIEAWHWNPQGTWSDGDKGYFVGNATLGEPIRHSYGYPLPHAGFSHPDGNSYSRLTDGDTR